MTNSLEDRVVAVEEYARDTSVELRSITYRLDEIERNISQLTVGMERVETIQGEHTQRLIGLEQRLGRVEGTQADHTHRFERIETLQTEHTRRFERLESNMGDITQLLTQILDAVRAGE